MKTAIRIPIVWTLTVPRHLREDAARLTATDGDALGRLQLRAVRLAEANRAASWSLTDPQRDEFPCWDVGEGPDRRLIPEFYARRHYLDTSAEGPMPAPDAYFLAWQAVVTLESTERPVPGP